MIKHKLGISLLLTTGLTLGALLFVSSPVSAATLTVNSADDTSANDGVCTLREAITAANNDTSSGAAAGECAAGSGTDTINFEITTGGTPFTNQGEQGYTISPGSGLPTVTETVTINGYTQDGADPNSAVAPEPMDGVLLIQIDGASAGVSENGLNFDGGTGGSAGSSVTGLVIINFAEHGVQIGANNISIQGNYIGTNYTGLTTTDGNGNAGVTNESVEPNSDNAIIGGTNPAHRNIISGNEASGGYPKDGWVIQGNYVGIGSDGVTEVPNSGPGGSGAFSIDECVDVVVGGTVTGAANVISGNASHGLAPLDAQDLTIQGNLIGTDYTGTQAVPNENGVTIGGNLSGSVLGGTTASARNIISGNTEAGVLSGSTGGLRIEGNYIGLDITGQEPVPNGSFGVAMGGVNETLGGSAAARNVISGNAQHNVGLYAYPPFLGSTVTGNEISANYIGTDADGSIDTTITTAQGAGVVYSSSVEGNILGGTTTGEGNRIAGNRGYGVGIRTYSAPGVPVSWSPADIAILGNQIYGNTTGGFISGGEGIGIDLYEAVDDEPDFVANTLSELGVNANDLDDADTGPNAYINFPVLNSATQDGTDLTLNLDLDAAGTTDPDGLYRVELFANDEADPSGYGEGQTYLGFANVANGDNQDVTITLAEGTDLTGKVLSATTTAMNNTTNSTYGSTSEFSLAADVEVIAAATENTDSLANTGWNIMVLTLLAGGMITASGLIIKRSLSL